MATTNTNFKVKNGLDAGGDISTTGKLNVNASSGDEGGEIFLNKAVTNTTINGGVTIDVYQNKLRFFEQGGSARGFYLDITAGGAGVGSNLATGGGGGTGTVTSVAMTVPTGLSISGSPITSSGTLALTLSAGYSIPTTSSQTNWNSAYGWGDHASAGYLTTSSASSTYQTITPTEIPNAADLNTYTTTGTYVQSSNAEASAGTNYPEAVAGTLRVVANSNASEIWQTYHTLGGASTNKVYQRGYYVTWSAWKEVATTSSIGSTIQAWNADLDALAALSGTGIAKRTGTDTWTTITDNSSNWDTAYTDRNKWDGGSTGLTPATGRTSLGATTVGSNLFTLTNPSAVTFPRINADNTVTALSASAFKTAIGADPIFHTPVSNYTIATTTTANATISGSAFSKIATLSASTTYLLSCTLFIQSAIGSGTGTNFQLSWNTGGGGGPTGNLQMMTNAALAALTTSSTTTTSLEVTGFSTVTPISSPSGTQFTKIVINGIVRTGSVSAYNIYPVLSITNSSVPGVPTSITTLVGSYIQYTPLTASGSDVSIGTWA